MVFWLRKEEKKREFSCFLKRLMKIKPSTGERLIFLLMLLTPVCECDEHIANYLGKKLKIIMIIMQ